MDKKSAFLLALAGADLLGLIPAWVLLAVCLAGLLVFSVIWTDAGGR